VADDCGALDFTCKAKEWAGSAIGDAISSLADGVMEAFGHAIGALGTIWVRIGTPNLTGGATVVPAGEPPGTAGIDTVLGYATWIGFGVAVIGLIAAGVRLALSRSGQTQQAVERIGVVLIAVILISASVGIVTALLAPGRTASPTVSFLQNSLWYYTLAVAVLGVIVAGTRMAWEQRADPGKQLVQGLLTLVVVAGAGLSVVALLTSAADAFSVWILNNSLDCNIAAGDGTCFGQSMFQLLSLTSGTTGGLGAVLAIILGVFAVFAALAQVVLLVVLAGMLPIAAAASLSDPQRTMFRKTSAWLLGFILYKPAAAIVYAAAFRLAGTNLFGDDGLVTVLTGLALMVLALVALPALMRLIVPAVTAVSGGGSLAGLGLAGAAAALPTGAAAASRLSGAGSSGSGGGPAGPTGSAGTAGGGGSGAGSSGAAGAAASGGASAAAGAAVPPVAAASAAMTAASAAGRAARTAAETTTTGGGPDGAV
jgi:hypothetical protein